MGLLDAFKQYVSDALPGGLLNPETKPIANRARYASGLLDPKSPISNDLQNWHKRTQMGLADQLAGRQTPAAEQAYQTMMQMAGVAPVGMTAWHGSPHKFDKFSLDKIGTGEGAQAYGHGLYFAQNPGVANNYAEELAKNRYGGVTIDGKEITSDVARAWKPDSPEELATTYLSLNKGNIDSTKRQLLERGWEKAHNWLDKNLPRVAYVKPEPQLYKTDIPDEAVARFLDWDKPVPEDLRQMISKKAMEQFGSGSTGTSGEHLYKEIARELGNPAVKNASPDASAWLAANGIPGIRYLDGGSRGAGSGTSNFVAFDPEMIRILERNGQATGSAPWKPGEWKPR